MMMEMEDLRNRMRDINSMKVTREIQFVSQFQAVGVDETFCHRFARNKEALRCVDFVVRVFFRKISKNHGHIFIKFREGVLLAMSILW